MNNKTFICITTEINYSKKEKEYDDILDICEKNLSTIGCMKKEIKNKVNKYDVLLSENQYLMDEIIEIFKIINSNDELKCMFEKEYKDNSQI